MVSPEPFSRGVSMAGTVLNLLVLGFLFLAVFLCVLAPLGALGIMFWNWQRELSQIALLKRSRSTQVK